MTRLTKIGIKYNTDKAYEHKFTEFYEQYFSQYVNPAILEIGVYNGASLLTYQEYFNFQCSITGLDNGFQLNFVPPSGIVIKIADQSDEESLLQATEHSIYDIIIDDGSHMVDHQILTFNTLWPQLRPGGIFIIEDLHSNLHAHYNPHNNETCLQMLLNMKENLPADVEFIEIYSDVPLNVATNLSHITSIVKKK